MPHPETPDRRLHLGPPGSGLTATLVQELTALLRAPATEARRLLYVVPNHAVQLTLQRLLFRDATVAAFPSVILPLDRLPDWLGFVPPGRGLSAVQEALLLRQALEAWHNAGDALLAGDRPGIRQAVRRQIRECREAGYLPDRAEVLGAHELEPLALPVFPWGELLRIASPRQQAVLEGFRQVWIRYEQLKWAPRPLAGEVQAGGWLDTLDRGCLALIQLEAERSPCCDWLAIDGFTEFTALQWRLVRALIRQTPVVRCALATDTADPGLPFRQPADPRLWFAALLREELLLEEEWHTAVRRTEHPALLALHGLLPDLAAGIAPDPALQATLASGNADAGLSIGQPADRRREVDQVLRTIRGRVQRGDAPYLAHLVIVPDLDQYGPLLRTAAASLEIPLALDQQRLLAALPLARHWQSLAQLLAGEIWPRHTLADLLSLPQLAEGAHWQRAVSQWQRLLAHTPVPVTLGGWEAWFQERQAQEQPLLAPVQAAYEALREWHLRYQTAGTTGQQLEVLTDAFQQWLAPAWMRLLIAENATAPEGLALRELIEVAEQLLMLADSPAIEHFNPPDLLDLALEAEGVREQTGQREVLWVVEPGGAREREALHVAVLGLIAGQWPRRPQPEAILPEEMRLRLSEIAREGGAGRHIRAGAWSRPDWQTPDSWQAKEAWLFQVACTRARESLLLSAPQMDEDRELLPAPWWNDLAEQLKDTPVHEMDAPGQRLTPVAGWTTVADAAAWLACYHHEGVRPGSQAAQAATRHARAQLGTAPLNAVAVANALQAIAAVPNAVQEAVRRWPQTPAELPGIYGERKSGWSASRLQTFAQCPFLYFARYGCRLDPLPPEGEQGLQPMERGTLLHDTLEEWLNQGRSPDPQPLLEQFDRRFGELAWHRPATLLAHQRAAMERQLLGFLQAEAEELPWTIQSSAAEVAFGIEEVMELPLGEGAVFRFNGKIDRLDSILFEGQEALVLIDYKTSVKGLLEHEKELREALAGDEGNAGEEEGEEAGETGEAGTGITLLRLDLQLPLYCYAAWKLTGKPVLAAFHFPLRAPDKRFQAFLPGSGSWRIGAWLGKGAEPLRLPSNAELQARFAEVAQQVTLHLEQLTAGRVEPKPLLLRRCGAGSCDYHAICRFEDQPVQRRW